MRPLRNNHIQAKLLKSNQGFTIIEILIALALVVFILGMTLSDPFSTDGDLDKQADDLERAVRFMSDEAALRNSVIRLHVLMKKAPQEYAIEYGPSDSFVLPPESEFETKTVSKEEEEKALKVAKELNSKFNKIKEFQESNTEIPDSVKILGVGNSNSEKLKTTGEASIYAFPTGEKDDALIILANEEKIISIAINPFNSKVERKSYKVEAIGNREINDVLDEKAKEIFETWLKAN